MTPETETHYDVLGVDREASPGDIARAYNRLVEQFAKDTTPPDPRRQARIRKAYEVLFDTAQREEYDLSIEFPAPPPDRRRAVAIGAAVAVALGLGAYALIGRDAATAVPASIPPDVAVDVARSVGRLQAFDLAGKAVATGIAFTVAQGVMASTCDGLLPGTQIVVTIGTRPVAARIAMADEALGLCKLAVDGSGSWPLPSAGPLPHDGDKVFAAGVSAAGEVTLAEGTVRGVVPDGARRLVDTSFPAQQGIGGRPLLDAKGRVVAVALAAQPGGGARHVALPAGWATESRAPVASPKPPQAPPGAVRKGP